ncbi:MAG: glycosyltransferase family 4 protein, partial [Bacteroidetes bacterium]|nr:glycosyltransferase family 4 protein [Bacteroidota bacterium]
IHDYFYVKQNIQFGNNIDVAVAHSSFFSDCVFASNPTDFANRTFYIPYGVKQYLQMPVKESGQPLKLFFLGRLDHGKGVEKLIDIENKLKAKAIDVEWTVIGMGKLESEIKQQWNGKTNVSFEKPQSSVDVYNVLLKQDVFVFPTEFEGTPVSIMEALSNANVVIVSDLPGGIRDMVTTDVGYRVSINNTIDFANQLELLHKDRALLKTLQENAWQKAVNNFNAEKNSDKYFELFLRFDEFKRKNTSPSKIRLNYLDKPYFPNVMVKLIRKILSKKI